MRKQQRRAGPGRKRPADSRQAVLSAAVAEFAAQGFRGATVDAIARRARVNKAMIYYHFENKLALYHDILRGIFTSLRDRTSAIAASDRSPSQKLEDFIDAFGSEADRRPYLPRLMMLEVADGARHLDPPTLRIMAGVFLNLRAILEEGCKAGAFRQVNPLLTYFNIVSPTMFFRAAAPLREIMSRHNLIEARMDTETFSAHLKATALRALAVGPEDKPGGDSAQPVEPNPSETTGDQK